MQAKSSQAMDQAFLKLPKYAAQAWPSQAVMPISMAQADPSGQNMRSRAQDFQAGPSQAAYGQIYARGRRRRQVGTTLAGAQVDATLPGFEPPKSIYPEMCWRRGLRFENSFTKGSTKK
jgi:hypothetical protein